MLLIEMSVTTQDLHVSVRIEMGQTYWDPILVMRSQGVGVTDEVTQQLHICKQSLLIDYTTPKYECKLNPAV